MGDPFVHLRVATGYSLQYGASHPSALVEAAAGHDMDTLACTDRDGLYGAVRFAKACHRAGIAPVVGADLAVGSHAGDRAVVLAESRRGWASLCRLVSAAHLGHGRGDPLATVELIGRHRDEVVVVLGHDSDLGRALAGRDDAAAGRVLRAWLDVLEPHQLVVGATNHRIRGQGPGSASLAGRMLAFADAHGLTGVLTNAVRMARKSDAPLADVLDAARRLVPLDLRNVDRRNAEGYLKSGKEMLEAAEEAALLAGHPDSARLIGTTRDLAARCRLDPIADIGLGEIHLPEFPGGMAELRARCEAGLAARYANPGAAVRDRLADELAVIEQMGFASYFLTVARVVDDIAAAGIRVAARGSGAGSLVNYCLGISGVDPIRYGLVMERFLSPLRRALPDIDIDVESARRLEIYDQVFAAFGADRVAAVAMLDTYRVRHAIRDVGAAMSLPPGDIDAIAKAFPHIRARDVRHALRELPELRRIRLDDVQLDTLFTLVEGLDGLPRHVALHPCGVILSDVTLRDRTPVEESFGGYAMSQFDKDDVEDLGLLKLDILGVRMQSAMAHAVAEVERVAGERIDLEALAPFDDPEVYAMIARAETIGCFQIESPGQRELVGKFGPDCFDDIIIDISLFRPGPVKSDMVVPFLRARNGWSVPHYLHPDLIPALAETRGVIVFHEQVIKVVAAMTGCSLAYGDEARRALGSPEGQEDVRRWFIPTALARGYDERLVADVWQVLVSFASFGFCKAHAAAFALPTYQSAWLKRHHPAAFFAGLLTHDPGMYPKRLILAEARRMGIPLLPLDVNASASDYRIEPLDRSLRCEEDGRSLRCERSEPRRDAVGAADHTLRCEEDDRSLRCGEDGRSLRCGEDGRSLRCERSEPRRDALDAVVESADMVRDTSDAPPQHAHGIRLALADVKGITAAEIERIVAGQPYAGITDFWRRAHTSAGTTDHLVLAGAFDALYGIGAPGAVGAVGARGAVTRRDLLLAVADLARADRVDARAHGRARGLGPQNATGRQSVQLAFDFGDPGDDTSGASDIVPSGLPEMTADERMAAELDVMGLDATRHVLTDHLPFLRSLGVTTSDHLLKRRSRSRLLVAGVKVATQTPPVRSGKRVIFLTLDDSTGPVDLTFFADAQGEFASTVFNAWLLVGLGELRRTGPRGVSLRALGAWDLLHLHSRWQAVLDETGDEAAAVAAVREIIDTSVAYRTAEPGADARIAHDGTLRQAQGSSRERPRVEVEHDGDLRQAQGPSRERSRADTEHVGAAGGMGQRRVWIHPSGFVQSPYTDIKPAGADPRTVPKQFTDPGRKLWHSSPGSSGR